MYIFTCKYFSFNFALLWKSETWILNFETRILVWVDSEKGKCDLTQLVNIGDIPSTERKTRLEQCTPGLRTPQHRLPWPEQRSWMSCVMRFATRWNPWILTSTLIHLIVFDFILNGVFKSGINQDHGLGYLSRDFSCDLCQEFLVH